MKTQVAIIGAGPAGLTLAHLLQRFGIESVVVESHSRDYVEARIRAGVLEQNTVEIFRELGLAERLDSEGIVHSGIELRYESKSHRVPFDELIGRSIWVYGQHEVVKDLISARVRTGEPILFETEAVAIEQINSDSPLVRCDQGGVNFDIECEFVVGCDGFHGVAKSSIPISKRKEYFHEYPFGWVGILAAVPPSTNELIYASHSNGFALHSLRSTTLSRFYLQCPPEDKIEHWEDSQIWNELHLRFEKSGWSLNEGPIIEKSITAMRSYVIDPMQYGRLFLAGDSAHIVPPTGAKGLNLAVADVCVLAEGMYEYFKSRNRNKLDKYTEKCLDRVWKVMHFSWWMTQMLHIFPGQSDETQRKLQIAQLNYLTSSRLAMASLAEQYTGLPLTFDKL